MTELNCVWLRTCLVVMFLAIARLPAQLLAGEQDYGDGAIVTSNSSWLSAQSNEASPFSHIWTDPATITWQHSGLPIYGGGILTIALWDLDNAASGAQITGVSFNGVQQPASVVAVFEQVSSMSLQVRHFRLPVPASSLMTGSLAVSLTLGNTAGNEVGIDFAELSPLQAVAVGGSCLGASYASLQVSGSTSPGQSVLLADPGATPLSLIAAGGTRIDFPLGGVLPGCSACTLVPQLDVLAISPLTISIPTAPSLIGVQVWAQGVVLDIPSSNLPCDLGWSRIGLTDAIEITVGP